MFSVSLGIAALSPQTVELVGGGSGGGSSGNVTLQDGVGWWGRLSEGPSAYSGGGRERACMCEACVCFGGVCWGVSMCFERRVCNNGPARPTHLLLGTVVWREAMVVLSVMLMVMFPGCAHITTLFTDVKNSQCQFALTSFSDQLNLNSEI